MAVWTLYRKDFQGVKRTPAWGRISLSAFRGNVFSKKMIFQQMRTARLPGLFAFSAE